MALTRNVATLKSKLVEEINHYLTIDNPEPEATAGFFAKAAAAAVSFYSRTGSSGRERAKGYKQTIENSTETESALIVRVVSDVSRGDSCLKTSSKLRDRLLNGLCNYFGITSEQVRAAAEHARREAIGAMTFASAQAYATIPPEEAMRRSAILQLLSRHIAQAERTVNYERSQQAVLDKTKGSYENRSLIGDKRL